MTAAAFCLDNPRDHRSVVVNFFH
uniref:PIN7 n=1 Tax=Arundo donax TaxID=35708 RepID=A0A0A9FFD6_ARUDO